MTHLLRYTGTEPKTFTEAGTLEPGAEFEVADDRVAGFTRRADVRHSAQCPACAEPAAGEAAPEPGATARRPRKAQGEAG